MTTITKHITQIAQWGLYSPAVVELICMVVVRESMHGRVICAGSRSEVDALALLDVLVRVWLWHLHSSLVKDEP